jgi:2-polyprenyl-3-methyl-5-hydroxy-6-metoxy-1,4-benzoquinol methylase
MQQRPIADGLRHASDLFRRPDHCASRRERLSRNRGRAIHPTDRHRRARPSDPAGAPNLLSSGSRATAFSDAKGTACQRAHFDRVYRSVDVDQLVAHVRTWRDNAARLSAYLEHMTGVHASWHGLYLGDFAGRIRGARVLELGSGDVTNACVMAALGANVTASDISSETGRIVREVVGRTGLRNLNFERHDVVMFSLPPRSVDFVVGKAFIHHLSHDEETEVLANAAALLCDEGEARFFETAVNSALLDRVRWIIPVPGRPSILARRAFREWQDADIHPFRDNSSAHYIDAGHRFFDRIQVVPVGCLERFYRLMPRSKLQRAYRRWAHRAETHLPQGLQRSAARAQLIVFRSPRRFQA